MSEAMNAPEKTEGLPDAITEGALVEPATLSKATPVDIAGQQKPSEEELSAKRKKRLVYVFAAAALVFCLVLVGIGFAFGWFSPTSALMQTTQEATQSSSKNQNDEKSKDDASTRNKQDLSENKAKGEESQSVDKGASGETADNSLDANAPDASSGSVGDSNSGNTAEPILPPEPAPLAPATITVSVYVDSSEAVGHGWPASLASATVSLNQGASVYDALCATGASVGGLSSYVESINGLAQFSCGPRSGWLYYVNGISPGFGPGSYILQGGENITWHYVLEG